MGFKDLYMCQCVYQHVQSRDKSSQTQQTGNYGLTGFCPGSFILCSHAVCLCVCMFCCFSLLLKDSISSLCDIKVRVWCQEINVHWQKIQWQRTYIVPSHLIHWEWCFPDMTQICSFSQLILQANSSVAFLNGFFKH